MLVFDVLHGHIVGVELLLVTPWKLARCFLVLREKAFRSVPAQRPLNPVSSMHGGIISNRNIPSTSGWQPWAVSIDCNILGVSLTTMNSLKNDFLWLILGVLLNSLWLWEELVSPSDITSFKMWVCVLTYSYCVICNLV